MNRCKWCNLNNPKYIDYHNEWGVLKTDDHYLFEMLILESFQAGLSWECILNKRKAFREAYDNFDIDKICNYINYVCIMFVAQMPKSKLLLVLTTAHKIFI